MNIFTHWLVAVGIFLHLISPAAPAPIIPVAVVQMPNVSQVEAAPVIVKTVQKINSPAPVGSTQVQVQSATYQTPSGAVIDAQGNVVNQADIDAQNQAAEQQSLTAQNALRLQQAQAAASSSNAILQANADALKASQLKDLQNQIVQAQLAIVADQQQLVTLQADLQLANNSQTSGYSRVTLQKEIDAANADISQQQNTVQSVQIKIDVLNQ